MNSSTKTVEAHRKQTYRRLINILDQKTGFEKQTLRKYIRQLDRLIRHK